MVSLNREKITFAIGLTSGIISILSLIFTCIGVGLSSWYSDTNANNTMVVAQANLFYSCFASNVTSGTTSPSLTCTSYNSFICSTISYQNYALNVTAYLPGCTNPTNGSSLYSSFYGPIYQVDLDSFYRIRSAATLSIISILFIFFTTIFAFLTAFIVLNIYLVFIAPILASIGVIFGVCCLVTAGSVFTYAGVGFALFTVGILLELIVIPLLSIMAGRILGIGIETESKDDETIYTLRTKSPIVIRRIHKRRI